MGGLRQDYAGRQRLCGSCGTIWRMRKTSYGLMIAVAVIIVAAGALLPYLLWGQMVGDIVTPAWLVSWLVFLWPLYYRVIWRFRMKGKIG